MLLRVFASKPSVSAGVAVKQKIHLTAKALSRNGTQWVTIDAFAFIRRSCQAKLEKLRHTFTIHHSLFTIHASRLSIHYSPFTIHYSPFTTLSINLTYISIPSLISCK